MYILSKGYRNYLYKVSTQLCSFERGVLFIFQYKGLFCYDLIYLLICCKRFVCLVILCTESEDMNKFKKNKTKKTKQKTILFICLLKCNK